MVINKTSVIDNQKIGEIKEEEVNIKIVEIFNIHNYIQIFNL